MLDFRIATFLKLCETKSYTNTAKILHITQPSVTQHIKYLQKRYQCKLFSYEGKTLRLTPEGEYLRRHALEMTQASAKVCEDLQRMSCRRGNLRFGCTKELSDGLAPQIIAQMMGEEELELTMHVAHTEELVELLECGKLDFILTDKSFAKNGFAVVDLIRDSFCAWASPQKAEELYDTPFKRLLQERLLVREEGSGSRAILERILEHRACGADDFHSVMVCNTHSTIREMTAAGMGISFCFAASMHDAAKQGRVQKLYLKELSEERMLALMYLKTASNPDLSRAACARFKKLWHLALMDAAEQA